MIRRRQFITLLGGTAAAWSLAARAQGRPVRIGFLSVTPPAASPGLVNAFRDGLRDHGYIEGQNLVLEYRWPTGSFERSSEMVAELARNVDVIMAWTSPAVIAARRATSTVPIVMVGVADPVGMGFIANLARPGGNVTGTSSVSNDLSGKLVEMLVEIVPGIRRIGVVANPDNPGVALQQRQTEEAARAIGRDVQVVSAHTLEEFQSAFARLGADGTQGVLLLADPTLIEHAQKIAELAQQAKLPTLFQRRENVDAGGLLSYGPNLQEQFRKAADYIDRIFKGARPADLPVEQPTRFELVINLKTAKALGLTVPPTLLAIADDVIE